MYVRVPQQQPPQPQFDPKTSASLRMAGIVLVVLSLASAVLAWALWAQRGDPHRISYDPQAEPRVVAPRGDLSQLETSTIDLFREAAPSVVYIQTHDLRRDRFRFNVYKIPRGTGSGFIWDRNGHIVTNFHVIEGAGSAEVILADQSSWTATLVGAAPDKDLAVLHIDAPPEKLRPIPVGTSRDLVVGQSVFAIGNPFGLDHTLTTGIVSGLGREIESATGRPITGVIQTDAAINPGNSGGPLLDSAGRLIGINTSIISPSGAYAGIGFAVPVDTVNRIVPQLIRTGTVQRPGLGIEPADDRITRQLGLTGALVLRVLPDSAAHAAGLLGTRRTVTGDIELGDRIIAIDDDEVTGADDLFRALDRHAVGDEVRVRVRRGPADRSREVDLTITLQPVQ